MTDTIRPHEKIKHALVMDDFIDFEVSRLGTTVTDRTLQLVALVKKHGTLMKAGHWGGFPFTRHQRVLLSHPHIQGPVPTYRCRSIAKKVS